MILIKLTTLLFLLPLEGQTAPSHVTSAIVAVIGRKRELYCIVCLKAKLSRHAKTKDAYYRHKVAQKPPNDHNLVRFYGTLRGLGPDLPFLNLISDVDMVYVN